MVVRLHSSGPKAMQNIMAEGHVNQEAERQLHSPVTKYKPQMHAPSYLFPLAIPYLPTVSTQFIYL